MEKNLLCHVKIETEDVTESFDTAALETASTLSFESPKGETHSLTELSDGWRYQKWGEAYLDFTFSDDVTEGLYRIAGQTIIFEVQTLKRINQKGFKQITYQLIENSKPLSIHTISITLDRVQEA